MSRSRSYSSSIMACSLLVGCGAESRDTELATDRTESELRRATYRLVRAAEFRGGSTTANGSARWYMPSVVKDQNGDGENDLLLGQPYGAAIAGRQGAVRILSGADLGELRVISPNDIDPTIEGTFGYSAHAVGDVNFDGRTDFAIGSPVIRGRDPADGTLDPAGYQNTGITWLARSRADGSFDVERFVGDDPQGFFGYWLAPVSFAVPRFLMHGPPGAWKWLEVPQLGIVSSQVKFRGGRAWGIEAYTGTVEYKASEDPANNDAISERRGYFIAPTGDLDGNGITDFLSTANGQWLPTDPDPRRYAGRVYFHDGLTGDLIRVIEGAHSTQFLGYRNGARAIDDIDRDGIDDVLVGSGQDGSVAGLPGAGVAYVISGRAIRSSSEKVLRIADHPEIVLRTHAGTNQGALFGDNMTNLFDMDADGVDEYAIGGIGTAGTGETAKPSAGAVFVYSGRTGQELQRLEGEAANLFFGQATLADRANGTLYVVDVFFPDPATGRSIGRVVMYRAERVAD